MDCIRNSNITINLLKEGSGQGSGTLKSGVLTQKNAIQQLQYVSPEFQASCKIAETSDYLEIFGIGGQISERSYLNQMENKVRLLPFLSLLVRFFVQTLCI